MKEKCYSPIIITSDGEKYVTCARAFVRACVRRGGVRDLEGHVLQTELWCGRLGCDSDRCLENCEGHSSVPAQSHTAPRRAGAESAAVTPKVYLHYHFHPDLGKEAK